MRSLRLEVFGDPVPQGSKRAFVVKGRAILAESAGARLKTWRQDIVGAARDALNGSGPFEGPVNVVLWFWLRQPKKPKHSLPITRPDADKLTRSVLDALEAAGVVRDDAQVTTLSVRKRYSLDAPRMQATISEESP